MPLRGDETQLLISFVRPHKVVSKDTIIRWIKSVLANSSIDTSQFGAHSTRAASTSAAKNCGLDMATIMKAAGWLNASTFALFYRKPIQQSSTADFCLMLRYYCCLPFLVVVLYPDAFKVY